MIRIPEPINALRRSRGFTIVAAIFLLVVLSALGAAIVIISTSQQIGSALDVQGTRAYQAARAGIEWGLYQRLQDTWAPALQPTPPLPANDPCSTTQTSSFTFPAAAATLAGFTVTVSCTAIVDTTNSGPTVATITAVACNQAACPAAPSSNYIERQIAVKL
jgi:MSHA biogenesis protein MshP